MRIYTKYIIQNLVPLFILTLCVSVLLVWILQIFKFLHLINKGIRIYDFIQITLLALPLLIFILMPIVTSLSCLFFYNKLIVDRQLIILQTSGLSNFQIAKPAILVSIFITLFAYYISADLLPKSYRELKSKLENIKNHYVSNIIEEKTFVQLSKNLTIYVNKKLSNNKVLGVILFDNYSSKRQSILFAEYGELLIENNKFVIYLSNGARQAYDHNNQITNLTFDSIVVKELLSQNIKNDIVSMNINEYYINELLFPNNSINHNQKLKLISQAHQRLTWPAYNFILIFIGLAIFLHRNTFTRDRKLIHYAPVIVITIVLVYSHFAINNMSSKHLYYSYLYYLNIILCIAGGAIMYNKK
ncbi:MAG: LptF/LptG family permease [Rickettsiaceae bacterium]